MSDARNRPASDLNHYNRNNSEYRQALYDGYASVMLGQPPNYELYTSIVGGSAYANGRLDAMEIRKHFPTLGFMDIDEFCARNEELIRVIARRCFDADTSIAPIFKGCLRWRAPHLVRQDLDEALKAAGLGGLAADDNMTTTY